MVHEVLRSPGEPLPEQHRASFEARLGTDLSGVRIHSDARAAASAHAVGGRAYTVGPHVVFSPGAYAPGATEGQRLLAHELAHVAQQQGATSIPTRLEIASVDEPIEDEAERFALDSAPLTAPGQTVAQHRPQGASPRAVLARYAHQDCAEADLKGHVWPADYLARQMVTKAIGALSMTPIDPSVAALLPKYFMTSTPDMAAIRPVFDSVDTEFSDNDYTYECEEDCPSNDNGYTWSGIVGALTAAHIHLCMNNFRSRSNECLARTIVHEFTHRYAGTSDNGYCKTGCGYSTCPSGLTPAQALANADSYACFAYELWSLAVSPPPAPTGADGGTGPVDAGLPGGVP